MSITLNKVGNATSVNGAEIPAFDPASDRLYVVAGNTIDVYTVGSTGALMAAGQIAAGFTVGAGQEILPNSVAVKNGIVAVAYAIRTTALGTQQAGKVSFFNAETGDFLNAVDVGFLPDMLTFTPDGTRVLVANEGEPNEDYTVDPEGSISIINISGGVATATVQNVNFNTFDAQLATLKTAGVRIIGNTATVSQDLEPEYIAIAPDGLTAKITLQENNAIATLDIVTGAITEIKSLGLKNFNLAGNGIDASDRDVDGTNAGGGKINIKNWPVFGAYMPDAIASYTAVVGGQTKTYYITANEGDSRVRPTANGLVDGQGEGGIFNEEIRVGNDGYVLDPTIFPNAADLKKSENLGRLTVTNKSGDTDGDGDFDQIVAFGGRSFSIWDANGTQVFDSGDQLEKLTAQFNRAGFNSDGTPNVGFDSRSDNKGPEPEGVTIGVVDGRTYAFVGLERTGDIVVYDVSNPDAPLFVQYLNDASDIGTEGLTFISAADSPTNRPLLITTSEVSKTVSVFETSPNYTLQLLHYYGESGLLGVKTAPIMGALIDKFDDQYSNTIKLGEGDTYIPGPWLIGGADPSLNAVSGIGTTALGRPDIAIFNAFGTDVSSLGNHEFDLGSPVFQAAITPAGSGASAWVGAQFPFVATNLDFAADSSLRGIADASLGGTATNAFAGKEANTIKAKIAPYTVITKGGEKIGIVGATTYDLLSKSSPNGTKPKDDGNISTSDLQEVAAYIQASVEALKTLGVNKIILVDQLDTIDRNKALAPLVSGIDVMVAGGGHERLGDANDVAVAFNGHDANFVDTYPIVATDKDGKKTLIVTTDTEFSYLGRLVVDFDANGEIIVDNLNSTINGAYAANEATLKKVYESTQTADQIVASSEIGSKVSAITKAIDNVIISKDSNIFGYTKVYLEGDRVFGRAQEVNLGDISADANIYKASQALGNGAVIASLKNGGGLRASIGSVGETGEKLPPSATSVKPAGGISQLDIENALRFDNKLMVFDTTPEGLLNILNYAAGLAPGNGGYAQIGGVRFSYDPTKAAGQRVQDVAIYDLDNKLVASVVDNGVILAGAPTKISVVILNFTANGGDGYPIKANGDNFRYLLDNGTLSAPVDETLDFTAAANVPANTLGEQKAFQDFLKAFHSTPETAYNVADTPATLDQRIQNLSQRQDGIFSNIPFNNPGNIYSYASGVVGIHTTLNLSFNIVSNTTNTVNELIVYTIEDGDSEDDKGSINGLKKFLGNGRGKVISSFVSNRPDGFNGASKVLEFAGNSKFAFALIKNGTADDLIAGRTKEIVFSTKTTSVISSNISTSTSFSLNFEGFDIGVATTTATKAIGTGLQDSTEGEVLDFRALTGNVKVGFSVNREAAFNNFVGFYKVENAAGDIKLADGSVLQAGSTGYARAAVQNRISGIDLAVNNQGSADFNDKSLTGGSIFAPFIISNGTADQFLNGQVSNAYFAYLGANSSKVDHIRLLGDNTFGFEDLPGGGDLDYNDIIVKVKLS